MRLINGEVDERSQVLAARDGDASAQEWIIRQYTPPVFRFCLRMLRNEQDARDVTQTTLLRVVRNLHRFDIERRFSTWVFGIARNACIDEQRRRRRLADAPDKEPVSSDPSPLDITSRGQRAQRLREAMDTLPPMYREVLVLYHFEHLKYREIAEALDVPIGTVMNRIFRARGKLRDAYEAEEVRQ
ncbi:MAG: sigma-70 family RNA polymerase sigma factor [Alphaproteobacteria bacterium]|nr:sigma-70 family RNA polymerase sigma factor [Alphaproteobacteria bacterium]MCB9794133.1 sigma-70 family RNA polymerase sigma factor [Alphaproteobacteria bacterium]